MSRQQPLTSEAHNGEADWNDAPCALVVVDANFCILRANACFGFLTGASEREMIGERISRKFTTQVGSISRVCSFRFCTLKGAATRSH